MGSMQFQHGAEHCVPSLPSGWAEGWRTRENDVCRFRQQELRARHLKEVDSWYVLAVLPCPKRIATRLCPLGYLVVGQYLQHTCQLS